MPSKKIPKSARDDDDQRERAVAYQYQNLPYASPFEETWVQQADELNLNNGSALDPAKLVTPTDLIIAAGIRPKYHNKTEAFIHLVGNWRILKHRNVFDQYECM